MTSICSDEKVETIDFMVNNALERVIPEELYYCTFLVAVGKR